MFVPNDLTSLLGADVMPNGVPERRPLPAGSGGGGSLFLVGFAGGVGAVEEGPTLPFDSKRLFGGTGYGLGALSISIGVALEPLVSVLGTKLEFGGAENGFCLVITAAGD